MPDRRYGPGLLLHPGPDTGKELAAVFDRFCLRATVAPVRTRVGRAKLLWADRSPPPPAVTLTADEIETARRQARALPWTADARAAFEQVLAELAREGVRPGDRRQVKTVGVVRAAAYLSGADEVHPEHLEVARHCLWDDPQEQPLKCAQVIAKIANPPGMRVSQLLLEAEGVLAAADPKDLAAAATAAAKLGEIDRQLTALKGNTRADAARAYLRDQLKQLRLASLDAV